HDQTRHAICAVDAAPAIAAEIEGNKKIAREKWRLDLAQLAGMADRFVPLGQKCTESLVGELLLGTQLAGHQSVHRIPTGTVAGCARPRRRLFIKDVLRTIHEAIPIFEAKSY